MSNQSIYKSNTVLDHLDICCVWQLLQGIKSETIDVDQLADRLIDLADGSIVSSQCETNHQNQSKANREDLINFLFLLNNPWNKPELLDCQTITKSAVMSAAFFCCLDDHARDSPSPGLSSRASSSKHEILYDLLSRGNDRVFKKRNVNGEWYLNDQVLRVLRGMIEYVLFQQFADMTNQGSSKGLDDTAGPDNFGRRMWTIIEGMDPIQLAKEREM